MRLKNVVLPAPLGPISAVIEPSPTCIVAPSTARMPPKRLTTPSAWKIALRPPEGTGVVAVAVAGASFTEDHLLLLAEHALRPERHQQDQRQAQDHEPQGCDLHVGYGQLDEAQPLQDHLEDQGSDGHAPVVGQPA